MSQMALQLKDLRKTFGKTEIIRGLNLEVRRGERHVVIGPNGAGKSTLFHLVSGRIPLSSGEIFLDGKDITGLAPHEIARSGMARSFQVTNVFGKLSVFENLRCALLWFYGHRYAWWQPLSKMRRVNERAEQVLEMIGLKHRRDTPAAILSYAELRSLEIGITVAADPQVILLDEPTAGMSRSESDEAVELIRSVTQGKTLVMVEHDLGVVFGLADRLSVLVYGRIIATGSPEEIRNNAEVQQAYLGTAHA
jgi:branched-chain amino acid transport system ATP-binding protein